MKKIFIICIVSNLLLTGCSSLFTIQTKSKIKASSSTDKIEVYNVSTEEYDFVGIGEGEYKLNNHNDYYLFKTSKDDKYYHTSPQVRKKFNALKLIDVAVPLIADFVLIQGLVSSSGSGNNLTGPAWIVGTLGWASLAFSPWKKYEPEINLPPIPSFPEPNNELGSIVIDKVSANVPSQNYKSFHFENLNDFNKNKKSFTIDHKESFKEDDLKIAEELNYYIAKLGFRDSTTRLFSNFYDSYKLTFEITEIINYKVGKLIKTEFKSNWNISYPYLKTPFYTQSISSTSNWDVHKSGSSYVMTFKEAILSNIREVLLDTNFISNLKASELKKGNSNLTDTIFVSKNYKNILNIENAVKSVVTVQNEIGHGSGCIISNDGYVITNYHVVSDTIKLKKILFNNGSSIPFKIIRVNEEYDLALLKIDTILDFPVFDINSNQKTSLGKEVYAIGTPSDIELGQTLSKGIISGQRVFNDKKFIQTDVSINSGNSGGALIDNQGNLLGIVTAKIVGLGVEGLGFSIPTNYINEALLIYSIKEEK